VLAQKSAQNTGKRESDCLIDRYLDDPLKIVFHGFLSGQQFRIDRIDFAETGIKRGRFSGASWPGGNENPVRPLNDLEDVLVNVVGHSEHLEIEIDGCAIK